ncbi:MAG TPA: PIG-L family deacetylase [Rhizomicrobium sp.]|nr:PIG-L family deacetylase [Rhizomicrobium sp.]
MDKKLIAGFAIGLILLLGFEDQGSAAPSAYTVDAQPNLLDRGAAQIWKLLKKLHTRASLLMIVAHPDDEDGATLTYESRGLGVRTGLMTLNRGEGGANVMSSDLWDALGLVRTEELLQAGRFYGLDGQYFSSVVDYGFSKSLKEALDQWGHARVLEDAVRVVRAERPLVVSSVFVGGPTDGHGNHAVAGMLAQEVFKAAGDPKVFPDQIRGGLLPWSPVKQYARVPVFRISAKGAYDYATHQWGPVGVQNYIAGHWEPGNVSTTVEVPVGAYDRMLGFTYLQMAREGLGLQKSQNGGAEIPLPSDQMEHYHRFGSQISAPDKEASFFDGIDVSLNGIADLAGPSPPAFLKNGLRLINGTVERAMSRFSPQDPSAIADILVDGLKLTDALSVAVKQSALTFEEKYNVLHELGVKQEQFRQALLASLEVSTEADVLPTGPHEKSDSPGATHDTFQMALPGQNIQVRVHLFNGSRRPIEIQDVGLTASSGKSWKVQGESLTPQQLAPDTAQNVRFRATVPADEPFTRPYFARSDLEKPYYDILTGTDRNMPLAPYPLAASVRLRFRGLVLQTMNVVQVTSTANGPGTLRSPMPVGPPVSVSISPGAGILPLDRTSFPLSVHLHNNIEGTAHETVQLELPSGWTSNPESIPVVFTKVGQDLAVTFAVHPGTFSEQTYQITAGVEYGGKSYKEGYTSAGYSGLRPYFLYKPSVYKVTGTELKIAPSLNIGYVEGSGDEVPAALEALGIHVTFLSPQDLAGADFSRYDSIVLGVRAYAVRPDLIANNARLLKYVENGGTVMVQYNTPEYDHNYGPYPYVMTDDPEEVTDEKSAVTFLDPKDPLLNWPNRITAKDFEGWVEERGSKFLSSWDSRYVPLLETHDEGQAPQRGGLLYARYGKGIYIYNAYAFYRQLPLGIPGAYRIVANLLSAPKNSLLRDQKSLERPNGHHAESHRG